MHMHVCVEALTHEHIRTMALATDSLSHARFCCHIAHRHMNTNAFMYAHNKCIRGNIIGKLVHSHTSDFAAHIKQIANQLHGVNVTLEAASYL